MYSAIARIQYHVKCKICTATSLKVSLLFLHVFVIMNGVFPDVGTVIVFNDYSSTV